MSLLVDQIYPLQSTKHANLWLIQPQHIRLLLNGYSGTLKALRHMVFYYTHPSPLLFKDTLMPTRHLVQMIIQALVAVASF